MMQGDQITLPLALQLKMVDMKRMNKEELRDLRKENKEMGRRLVEGSKGLNEKEVKHNMNPIDTP